MKSEIKNVLSLFGGIECGRVALERVGISPENYFSSEIDKWAIQVTKANWPDIQHIGDVRNVKASELPKIDLLIGGSPCQGFSFAGKMLNFDDPRSALFFEYVRILKEIRQINPNVVFLLENVPMKREWQMVISKYVGVEPIEIDAALVSAQSRRRLFWTNIKAQPFNLFGDIVSMVGQPKDRVILLRDILQPESEVHNKYYLSEISKKGMLGRIGKFAQVNGEKSMTITTRNAADTFTGDFICSGAAIRGRENEYGVKAQMLERRQDQKANSVTQTANKSALVYIEQTARGFNKGGKKALNGKSPSVSANSWEHNNHLGGYRRLTPVEVERLFTLPDNYAASVSDSQRYRLLGNCWVVDQVAHIFSHI